MLTVDNRAGFLWIQAGVNDLNYKAVIILKCCKTLIIYSVNRDCKL